MPGLPLTKKEMDEAVRLFGYPPNDAALPVRMAQMPQVDPDLLRMRVASLAASELHVARADKQFNDWRADACALFGLAPGPNIRARNNVRKDYSE